MRRRRSSRPGPGEMPPNVSATDAGPPAVLRRSAGGGRVPRGEEVVERRERLGRSGRRRRQPGTGRSAGADGPEPQGRGGLGFLCPGGRRARRRRPAGRRVGVGRSPGRTPRSRTAVPAPRRASAGRSGRRSPAGSASAGRCSPRRPQRRARSGPGFAVSVAESSAASRLGRCVRRVLLVVERPGASSTRPSGGSAATRPRRGPAPARARAARRTPPARRCGS